MSRNIIIGISVAVIVIVIVGALVLFGRSREGSLFAPVTATPQSAAEPSGPISYGAAPGGDAIYIQTARGVVKVNNFYKNISDVDSGTSAVVLYSDSNYTLWYYRADSGFEIAMNQNAAPGDEKTAADKLLKILGVGNPDLCKLKVSVTTPYDYGEERASQPLSFCAKGIQ